jgi:heavy metal sensor kinase
MTLTNRLTLFFLASLAVVLAGFSAALYSLERVQLTHRLTERVTSTVDTLYSVAESEPDGLEWDRKKRQLRLRERHGSPPAWAVYDESGQWIDGSTGPGSFLDSFATGGSGEQEQLTFMLGNGESLVIRQTLTYAGPEPMAWRGLPESPRYRGLVFVSAAPLAPVHWELRELAWTLAGISAGVWMVAGLAARWICRQALGPVRGMADAAKQIGPDDLGKRLPVTAARDEIHDLATAFNDLLTRVQESYERQRRFTGEASHQLRTPLAAMLGQMEVALRRQRDPEEYGRVLSSAMGQAERLRRIVEMLLFLARADAEARLPDLQAVDLRPWLADHLTATWGDHHRFIDLRLEMGSGARARILAQSALLGQAVDNLVDNAIKYSQPSSPVRVCLLEEEGTVAIVVEDRGPGIAAEEVQRVFEPFFRSIDARRRGVSGVGLGLAVTARIVKALGGKVQMKTRPGEGCTFTLLFPAVQ